MTCPNKNSMRIIYQIGNISVSLMRREQLGKRSTMEIWSNQHKDKSIYSYNVRGAFMNQHQDSVLIGDIFLPQNNMIYVWLEVLHYLWYGEYWG